MILFDEDNAPYECNDEFCDYVGFLSCERCHFGPATMEQPEDNYIGDDYYSGTGELIGDESYIRYLNS